ncbi:hypothetical protein FGO68_gene10838 [Halteria grandinella]|uniref:Transmembrane protein n=1 Tax=Halteria grandinella TaxID=5974 RepID=A0A8J8NEF6_HALGN|nr:hypothetical protein FGO68_gene10838 [Halteria grandinella]
MAEEGGITFMLKAGTFVQGSMQPQQNFSLGINQTSIQITIGFPLAFFSGLSVVTNLWAQSAIANIYSIFDNLSFLSVVLLVDAYYPYYLQFILKLVFQMSQFNIFPYNGWEKQYLEFGDDVQEAPGETFEQLGIQSYNFIYNSDPALQAYLLLFGFYISSNFLRLLTMKIPELHRLQAISWVNENLFQKSINLFFMVTKQFYLQLSIGSIIHLQKVDYTKPGEAVASYYAFIFGSLVVAFPICCSLLWWFMSPLKSRIWCQSIFQIGSPRDIRYSPKEVLNIWRMLFTALSLTLLTEQPIIQLFVLSILSLLTCLQKGLSARELFQEIIQLSFILCTLHQTELSAKIGFEEEVKEESELVGQFQIFIIGIALITQLIPLILNVIVGICRFQWWTREGVQTIIEIAREWHHIKQQLTSNKVLFINCEPHSGQIQYFPLKHVKKDAQFHFRFIEKIQVIHPRMKFHLKQKMDSTPQQAKKQNNFFEFDEAFHKQPQESPNSFSESLKAEEFSKNIDQSQVTPFGSPMVHKFIDLNNSHKGNALQTLKMSLRKSIVDVGRQMIKPKENYKVLDWYGTQNE